MKRVNKREEDFWVPALPTPMQVAPAPDPPLPSSQMILARFL